VTPSEVAQLVTYATSLDHRLVCDQDTARARVAAWWNVLSAIPPASGGPSDPWEAQQVVTRFYRRADVTHPLGPGVVVTAWEAWATRHRDRHDAPPRLPMPDGVRAALDAALPARRARGGALAVACPYPPCRAPAGAQCTVHDGSSVRALPAPHPARLDVASTLA
jgi:hypothetical protein